MSMGALSWSDERLSKVGVVQSVVFLSSSWLPSCDSHQSNSRGEGCHRVDAVGVNKDPPSGQSPEFIGCAASSADGTCAWPAELGGRWPGGAAR